MVTLEELADIEKLSTRTYNCLKTININTVDELLDLVHSQQNGNRYKVFKDIRGFGNKSLVELKKVVSKYSRSVDSLEIKVDRNKNEVVDIKKFVHELPDLARLYLNNYIEYELRKTNNRCYQAFFEYMGNLDCDTYVDKIFDFNIRQIKSIGDSTEILAKKFCRNVDNEIRKLRNMNTDPTKVRTMIADIVLKVKLGKVSGNLSVLMKSVEGPVPVFGIIDLLLDKNLVLNDQNSYILKKNFRYFNGQVVQSTNYTARRLDKTVVTIRRKLENLNNELVDALKFLKFEDNHNVFNFYNVSGELVVNISDGVVREINKNESTDFTPYMVKKILSIVLVDYFLVGDGNNVVLNTAGCPYKWRNVYVVNKEVMDKINFNNFMHRVSITDEETLPQLVDDMKKHPYLNEQKLSSLMIYLIKNEFEIETPISKAVVRNLNKNLEFVGAVNG